MNKKEKVSLCLDCKYQFKCSMKMMPDSIVHACYNHTQTKKAIIKELETQMSKNDDEFAKLSLENIELKKSIQTYKEALDRSEFDISPCGECGEPVICLPDGMSTICNECIKEEDQ